MPLEILDHNSLFAIGHGGYIHSFLLEAHFLSLQKSSHSESSNNPEHKVLHLVQGILAMKAISKLCQPPILPPPNLPYWIFPLLPKPQVPSLPWWKLGGICFAVHTVSLLDWHLLVPGAWGSLLLQHLSSFLQPEDLQIYPTTNFTHQPKWKGIGPRDFNSNLPSSKSKALRLSACHF